MKTVFPAQPGPKIYRWLDDRYQLGNLIEFLSKKDVPITRMSIFYYFGGVSLFLFMVQVITGILLLMYYVPSADDAYESVHYIMAKVQFGWLIRSIHMWASELLILSVMIHMVSVFYMRAYRKPRELTWVTGCMLLGVCFALGFSGYLLPWNELAFFATKIGTEIITGMPLLGEPVAHMLRGGEDVTGTTLNRFFGLHVAILPALAVVLITVHLIVIQRQGMSRPPEWLKMPAEKRRRMPFFPNFLLRDLLLWFIVLNVLAALAVFAPAPLGEKADPFAPAPAGIKPEWYFLAQYQVLKWLPPMIGPLKGDAVGIVVMSIGMLAIVLLPFLDRTPEGGPRRVWLDVVATLILIGFIATTVLGHVLH